MKKNAFTLIELLVVVSIIGILSAIGLITYSGTQSKARDTIRKNNLNQMSLALEGYFQKYGKFVPPGGTGIDVCSRDTDNFYKEIAPFMKDGKVPTDPKDNTPYCYVAIDKGNSYRLFAKVENCSDEKIITGLDCSKLTYKYSVTSDNLTVAPSLDDTMVGSPPLASCADGTIDQAYSNSSMVRCDGAVTYNQAASLCKEGVHVCSLQEYLTRGGNSSPISVSSPGGKYWWLTTSGEQVAFCGSVNNPWLEIRPDTYSKAFGAESFYHSALKDDLPGIPRAPFCGTQEWIMGYFYPKDKSTISEGTMCCSN